MFKFIANLSSVQIKYFTVKKDIKTSKKDAKGITLC